MGGGMRGCPGGDMHGFIQRGVRGFIWGVHGFIWGGVHGFIQWGVCGFIQRGACMVLFGGACVVLSGACMGGHAWFYSAGGVHGFIQWGACMVLFRGGVCGFFSFSGYNEIRSMSGRYASYWNAFLFDYIVTTGKRSCGKLMFSQPSVCRGEGISNIKCIMG